MLRSLEVIWIYDATLREPHPKMVACVQPDNGWFYRINSRPFLKPFVPLKKSDHPFLHHDSFLHCDILFLDDYLVRESLRRHNGIAGKVVDALKGDIRKWTLQARFISADDGRLICDALVE